MWQRFTERARRVILLGQEEAGKMGSGHVGTEHLLLGLVRENDGVAAQILQRMGVTLPKIRTEIEQEVQPVNETGSSEPKLTRKAKRVLELAADEAQRMRHNYIGTEHLLLALLREKDGLAAAVLRRLGLDLEMSRAAVMEYLGPDVPQSTSNFTEQQRPGTSPSVGAAGRYSSDEFQATLKMANDLIRPRFKPEFRKSLEQLVSLQILALEIMKVEAESVKAVNRDEYERAAELREEGRRLDAALDRLAEEFGTSPE